MRIGMSAAVLLMAPKLTLAGGPAATPEIKITPEIVAVVDRDPVLQIVVAMQGDVPAVENVQVSIEGSYAEVTSVQRLVDAGVPVATVIAVDTSMSMAPTFDKVQSALRTFVDGMQGGDVVLIGSFDEHVQGLKAAWQKPDGKDALKAQIDAMKANGRATHLNEAMNDAVDRLVADSGSYPLRTVLVLSDGEDSGSPGTQTIDRVRSNALANNIRVNSVGYVPSKTDSTKVLSDLATDTHGTYKLADDAGALDRVFTEIQTSAHQWLVVTVNAEAIPAGSHELGVQIGPEGHKTEISYALVRKTRFQGQELKGNDPPDRTALYAGIGVGASFLMLLAVSGMVYASSRRKQQAEALAKDIARQIEDTRNDARRLAEAARAVRPTRIRLLTADGFVDLFGADAYGMRQLGSDPEHVDVTILHDSVSRKHATMERRKDDPSGLYVTDTGSSNGSYHQGLDLRGRGTVRVGNRERLQFGLYAGLLEISEL